MRRQLTTSFVINGDGTVTGSTSKGVEFIFDEVDLPIVSQYSWYKGTHGYITTTIGGRKDSKQVLMHRLITNVSDTECIDHINGDKLDNLQGNLRIVTNHQNQYNKAKQQGNYTSKYKGACWYARYGTWQSEIWVNKKRIYLGRFKTELEAAQAYNKAALQYHGEFANINEFE